MSVAAGRAPASDEDEEYLLWEATLVRDFTRGCDRVTFTFTKVDEVGRSQGAPRVEVVEWFLNSGYFIAEQLGIQFVRVTTEGTP